MFSNFSIKTFFTKYSKIFHKFFKNISFKVNNIFKGSKYYYLYYLLFLFVSLFLFWVNYYLLFVVYDIKKVARFDIVADKDLFITGYTYETLEKLKKISEIKEYSIDIKKTQKTLYNLDQLFLPQLSKDTNKLKYYFNELEISLILSLKNEYVEYFYNVIKGYLTVKLENGIELEDIPDVVKEINDVLDINKLSSNPKEIQKLIAYKKIILTKLPKLIEFNKIFDIQKTLELQREYLKNIPKHFDIHFIKKYLDQNLNKTNTVNLFYLPIYKDRNFIEFINILRTKGIRNINLITFANPFFYNLNVDFKLDIFGFSNIHLKKFQNLIK